MATSTFNFNPQGSGRIVLGNPDTSSGGFTSLILTITQESKGKAQIQAVETSGTNWGTLELNPDGGTVVLPARLKINGLTTPPAGVNVVDLVIDPATNQIYRRS